MGDPSAKKEGAEKSGMRSTSLQKRQQRKAPEPLRRTIAECTLQHSSAALAPTDALKCLQDYLSEPSTIDMAYTVLLDHTLAERDRSPPVINKCVAILRKYLFRYVPDVSTLQQIDTFCMELIDELECIAAPGQGSQHAGGAGFGCPVRAASSAATVKSLSYVRGVVARHLPVRSPKLAPPPAPESAQRQPPSQTPAAPAKQSPRARGGATKGAKGALKTAATQDRDVANAAAMAMAGLAQIREDDDMYITSDVLRWRWLDGTHGSQGWMPAPVMMGSGGLSRPLPEPLRGVNESGAAALLERGGEAGDLLRSSAVLSLPDPGLMHMQVRMVAATKRSPPKGDQSAWEDAPASMRRRARPLFQYRHYSEQQPLRLSDAEMEEVVSSVCGEAAAVPRPGGPPHSAKPDTDVAASVLIKLLIDMYMADSLTAAPLTLSLLQGMLNQSVAGIRVRAFDMVLNLGVHAHLLEPMGAEESGSGESGAEDGRPQEGPDAESSTHNDSPSMATVPGTPRAVAVFEKWLLGILSEMLLFLVQNEEEEESVWTAAFSCLLYLICDRGRIIRSRLQVIDIRVLATLLAMGEEQAWVEELQTRLVRMLTNRLYTTPALSHHPHAAQLQHQRPQLDLHEVKKLGGIRYICAEFAEARTGEARRNLFAVLFDYVVHDIKLVAHASGKTPPSEEHVQAVATVLALADAPDSFVLAFKSAAIGVGDSIAHSIFTAMSRDVTSGRLNADLLTEITGALDAVASSYARVDPEFQAYLGVTLSVESQGTAEAISPDSDTGLARPAASGKSMDPGAVAQSWSVLRTLLHSQRTEDRANGRVWLLELLTVQMARGGTPRAGPSGSKMTTADLQRQLSLLQSLNSHGGGDRSKHKHQRNGSSEGAGGGLPTVSGAVRMLCGLLRARRAVVRRGFVHVLEQLLLQCQRSPRPPSPSPDDDHDDDTACHERAFSMLALMNGALWQLVASKDLDRVNILQMCKMMLSQLCVRRAPENALYFALSLPAKHTSSSPDASNKQGGAASVFRSPLQSSEKKRDGSGSGGNGSDLLRRRPLVSSVPLATQFLQGTAAAPRKLLQQMPTALLYWPLMQLAAVPNDSCEAVLATAVGSHGDGMGAGAASDVRAALLLLLIAKCSENRAAYEELGGDPFFRTLLDDPDARIAYFSSAFLLRRMMTEQPSEYQRVLHGLVFKAQQSNNEKLLENPYLQMRGLLQASAEQPKLHSFHSQAAQ